MGEADEIARVLHAADCGCQDYEHYNDVEFMDAYHREADAVLASDWLREHDATVLESARNRLNGHDPAGEQLQRMADEKRSAGREDES